jgi:CarD family transcriptional regulator
MASDLRFHLRRNEFPWYSAGLVTSDNRRLRGGFVFRKGDTVVHPEHGAAVIEELRDREFLGEKRKYLVLRVAYGDLTLMVPVDSTEEVGLRQVVSKNEVKKVLKVLTENESSMAANWSRRFKNNMEKLHSGDPYQVAEVLRNLAIRDREKGLSAGEKRMIQKARQILISELSYATGKTEEDAEIMIDDVLDEAHGSKVAAQA